MRGFPLAAVAFIGLAVLSGCNTSQGPEKVSAAKPESKREPVLYTANECMKRLDGQAKLWAMDARPVHIESNATSESAGSDGRSAVWRAGYLSAQRNALKFFMCSGSLDKDAPSYGLTAGLEMPVPPHVRAFDAFLLKADSDKAFTVAQEHGGSALLKKSPGQKMTYIVEVAKGETVPFWYVVYGKDLKDNQGIGIVNATTGEFVRATARSRTQ